MTETTTKAVELRCTAPVDDASFRLARTLYACIERTGHRIAFLSTPGDSTQQYFLCLPDTVSDTPPETIPEPIQTVAAVARNHLPTAVDVEIVTLELAPVGTAPAPVERLLDASTRQSLELSDTLGTRLLNTLIERAHPHLLKLVVAPTETDDLAVSLGLCEFIPEVSTRTQDAHAAVYHHNDCNVLGDCIDSSTLSTNRELLTGSGWTVHLEDRLPGPRQPLLALKLDGEWFASLAEQAYEAIQSPAAYDRLIGHAPELPPRGTDEKLGADPWVLLDSEQLSALCDLRPGSYTQSPWDEHPGRNRPTVVPSGSADTVKGAIPSETSPVAARVEELSTSLETVTSQPLVRQSLQWLLEQGNSIDPASPVEMELAVPTFRRELPTGEIQLLIIISSPDTVRGEIVTAARLAATQADGLTVVTATPADGQQVARLLLEPIVGQAATTFHATQLYTRPVRLSDDHGIAVYPEANAPVEWALTPDGLLIATQNHEIVADHPRLAPTADLASAFDRIVVDDEELIHTDPDGNPLASYDSEADVYEAVTPVLEPALPGTLADGLESGTVFARRGSQFTEVRLTAPWDQRIVTIRERDAGRQFLDRFTAPKAGSRLPLDEAVPQFASWLRHQTNEPLSTSLSYALRSAYADITGLDCLVSPSTEVLPDRTWIYQPFSDC